MSEVAEQVVAALSGQGCLNDVDESMAVAIAQEALASAAPEPIGYLWVMEDGSRHVMWAPIDPESAFYEEPLKYKSFTYLYGEPQIAADAGTRALREAAMELAQYASYAEITGYISLNRDKIREWCDKVFTLCRDRNVVLSATPADAALQSALKAQPCEVIHANYPKGTTCLDIQQLAASGEGRYTDDYRAKLTAGEGLCFRCMVRAFLAAPAESDPGELAIINRFAARVNELCTDGNVGNAFLKVLKETGDQAKGVK
jgi:hypothetical protein